MMRKTLVWMCLGLTTTATTIGCDLDVDTKNNNKKHAPTTQAADEILRGKKEKEQAQAQQKILDALSDLKAQVSIRDERLQTAHRETQQIRQSLVVLEKDYAELKQLCLAQKQQLDKVEAAKTVVNTEPARPDPPQGSEKPDGVVLTIHSPYDSATRMEVALCPNGGPRSFRCSRTGRVFRAWLGR